MSTFSFSTFIKRTATLALMVCFVFTALYVPQSHIKVANAQLPVVDSIQVVQNEKSFFEQLWDSITQTSILGTNIGKLALGQVQWSVTSILNGLAWTAAKSAISMIQRSIVRWINSGFQGSPSFIQDLGGFLTNLADETMGSLIQEIGGPLSIVCSPFRLNVQIALSTAYNQSRDKNARRCTLSGALQNIQNFIGGDMNQGGWSSWFQISQSPSSYTPYGSALNAGIEAGIRITNAQGQQVNILNWGAGFMSSKVCEGVVGANGPEQKCRISTPGSVISDQLNRTLGLGPDTLVTADQINEIIGALMQQLVTQVLTGAGGLLGAGGGQGKNAEYTNPNFNVNNYSVGMEIQSGTDSRELLTKAITIESTYLSSAKNIISRYESSYTTDSQIQQKADAAYNEARSMLPVIEGMLTKLEDLLLQYDTAMNEAEAARARGDYNAAATIDAKKSQLLGEYASFGTSLHSITEVTAIVKQWNDAVGRMLPREDTTVDRTTINDAITLERKYQTLVRKVIDEYETLSPSETTEAMDKAYAEANSLLVDIQSLIIELQDYAGEYSSAGDSAARKEVIAKFNAEIKPDLHTEKDIEASQTKWELVFGVKSTTGTNTE